MSKKKDFEYSGKLREIKQSNDDNNVDNHQSINQPKQSDNYPDDGHAKEIDDNHSSSEDIPDIQQYNNDDLNENNHNDGVHPEQRDNLENVKNQHNEDEPQQIDDNLDNSDDKDTASEKRMDEDEQEDNNQPHNESEEAQQDKTENNDNDIDDDGISQKENDTDDDSIKQEDSSEPSNKDTEKGSEESKLDDDSLKNKALNKIDPNLAKASKLKDLSKMNKEDAKEELIAITKALAKKKAAAIFVTYVLPVLAPIIGGLIILIAIILAIVGITTMVNNNQEQDNGCSVVDKASTNISNSKNAEKNAMNIYKYAKKNVKGSTNKGIASWLGNINEESGGTFSSSTIQGGAKYKESLAKDPSAGGYAFGFAQLDSDRRVKLLEYADKKDKKWSDMGLQLDYILNHDGTDSGLIKKLIKKDSDINTITADIMNDWERAGAKESLPKRQAASKKYYSKISKLDGDSDSNISDSTSAASDNSDAGVNSGCNKDSNSKVDGEIGASVKANNNTGKIVKKWSSKGDIPKKYKKYISIPDFKDSFLKGSPFGSNTALRGQCTELTYAYMKAMYKGEPPTNGNGGDLYNSYKSKGAKVTSNPTVGYGFSAYPPYAGAGDSAVGHTGVVAGVLPNGQWIMANYNLNLEAPERKLTYALVDGNKKKGGVKFFSGIGGTKIKSK